MFTTEGLWYCGYWYTKLLTLGRSVLKIAKWTLGNLRPLASYWLITQYHIPLISDRDQGLRKRGKSAPKQRPSGAGDVALW